MVHLLAQTQAECKRHGNYYNILWATARAYHVSATRPGEGSGGEVTVAVWRETWYVVEHFCPWPAASRGSPAPTTHTGETPCQKSSTLPLRHRMWTRLPSFILTYLVC